MAELLLELYSEEVPPQLQIAARSQIKHFIENTFKEENVKSDEKSLDLLVELAKGSVRDSLTLSDQAISHCDGNLDEESISKLHGVLDLSLIHI